MIAIEPQFNPTSNLSSIAECDDATMVELCERLGQAMELRGVDVSRLARATGLTYQAVRKLLSGESKTMKAANYIAVAEFLQVSSEWLRTGQGDRDLPPSTPQGKTISESQWALLEDFEMLPDDEKQALRSTLKAKADHVRKIVAEYLGRNGMTGTASDRRVEESFGAPPSAPAKGKTGAGSYERVTPLPEEREPKSKRHRED